MVFFCLAAVPYYLLGKFFHGIKFNFVAHLFQKFDYDFLPVKWKYKQMITTISLLSSYKKPVPLR